MQGARIAVVRSNITGIFLILRECETAIECLQILEAGLHLLPSEGIVVHHRCPLIIVVPRAYSIDPEVDCRATSQTLSAGIVELAPIAMFLRCGLVPPIQASIHECRPTLSVYSQSFIIIAPTCFKK